MERYRAQVTVEYLLVFAVVIVIVIVSLSGGGLGTGLTTFFDNLGTKVGMIIQP